MIPIDLTKVFSTEGNDYPLLPNDILYVPAKKKSGIFESTWFTRLVTVGISIGTGVLMYELLYKNP